MPLPPDLPQREALVPLAPTPQEPFPETIPAETFRGLSRQECQFVLRYLEHGNAARAFRDADITDGEPYTLLRRPRIKAALARAQAFFAYHIGLHAWQVLGALQNQAFLDPVEMYEQDGESWETKPMGQWPLHLRQCIQRVMITEWESDGKIKRKIDVEFTDRQHALFLLGKHLKLYEKSNRQMAPFTLVLNTNAPEASEMRKVGEVIEGIGLHINLPDPS